MFHQYALSRLNKQNKKRKKRGIKKKSMDVFALSFFCSVNRHPSGREQKREQALKTNRKQTEGESQGDTLSGTADTMGGAFMTQNVKQGESRFGDLQAVPSANRDVNRRYGFRTCRL